MKSMKDYLRSPVKATPPTNLKWFLSLLLPGLGVKRYFLLILMGVTLVSVGFGLLVLEVYRSDPGIWWMPLLSFLTLGFLPVAARALVFGGLGLALVVIGVWSLNRSLMSPFLKPGSRLMDRLREHRQLDKGPRIVALGGGHGLAMLLRGLKNLTYNLTAIVTVADDGGSSGRLRRELGILPPGDIRNCLAALSSDEALLGQLFQYRFPEGGLEGHSFGNLFISALAEITGSFESAVVESGRVLAVHGQVLPSTVHHVELAADVLLPNAFGEIRVHGESRIPQSAGRVRRVWLEPSNPPAFPQAIQALLSADVIVVGPGSLYTSVLPNLLVPDITAALRASRALKLFICNVASQPGETDDYTCGDHLRAIEAHVGQQMFDIIIANKQLEGKLPEGIHWVSCDEDLGGDVRLVRLDLIDSVRPWRHDSQKLSQIIRDLLQEQSGLLVE